MELSRSSLFFTLLVCSSLSAEGADGQSTTIFIHGTLFPIISYYYHGVSAPRGVTLAASQPTSNTLGKLGRVLSQAAPNEFPLDSFYLLGWPGHLNAAVRQKAAQDLYNWFKEHPCASLTLIGHSHGATIALLLAQLAAQEKNSTFVVDRLILIACPVQKVTCHLVNSPVFKKVYSLYSDGDIAQICDVQHYNFCIPVLSERVFAPSPNLMQAKILLNGKRPGHNDFLLNEHFLLQLPALLQLLDKGKSPVHAVANIRAGTPPTLT